MQMISEIMTRNVRFVAPHENLQHAAALMDELNVGVLPVCDGDRLIGMITDRDITIRATAAGVTPDDARVQEVMTGDVRWCFEDQSVDEVIQQMSDAQIRRVPLVTHDDQHRLIGIVALGDLATEPEAGADAGAIGQVVQEVSKPTAPQNAASADSFMPNEGLADGGGTATAGGPMVEDGADAAGAAPAAAAAAPAVGADGTGAGGESGSSGTGSGTGGGLETLSADDQAAVTASAEDVDAGAPSPQANMGSSPTQAAGGADSPAAAGAGAAAGGGAGNATGTPGGDVAGAGAPDTEGGSRP